jgi:hypothetical protein
VNDTIINPKSTNVIEACLKVAEGKRIKAGDEIFV